MARPKHLSRVDPKDSLVPDLVLTERERRRSRSLDPEIELSEVDGRLGSGIGSESLVRASPAIRVIPFSSKSEEQQSGKKKKEKTLYQ